jgi:hypothetical protein
VTDVFPVHQPENAVLDVVFVHGLDGDARKTWWRGHDESFWPQWLAEDLVDLAVWTVNYDAWSSGWHGRAMSMQDRAINLLAQLQNKGIGDRPLCFVAHSMGGLLVKEILLHAADGRSDFRVFATATSGVIFLATPHTGSGIAQAVDALGVLYRGTIAVEDLRKNCAHLRHLNDRYRDWVDEVKIRNLVFFESHPTRGVQVVDASSANPGIPNVRPIPVDANHIDMCKPLNRNSLVYGQVLRFIRNLTDQAGRPTREHRTPGFELPTTSVHPCDVALPTTPIKVTDKPAQTIAMPAEPDDAATSEMDSSRAGEHIIDNRNLEDLTIRPTSNFDGTANIQYKIGAEIFTTQVELQEIASLLSSFSTDFVRRTYRFGGGQVAEIEDMAARAFNLLLPPSVRRRLQSDEIRRVQVVADYADPCLPWELLHDGVGFVATRLPVLTSPVGMRDDEVASPVLTELLVIEGVPGDGVRIDGFLRDHFTGVYAGHIPLHRVTARNSSELRAAARQGNHNAIHFSCHTSVVPHHGVTFHLGRESVDAVDLCLTLGRKSHLTYLSGCETAIVGSGYSYGENAAYLLSATLEIHVVGASGWLSLATSSRFEESFYANYATFRNVETAITRARSDLYRVDDVGWWVLSLVGPKTKLDDPRIEPRGVSNGLL